MTGCLSRALSTSGFADGTDRLLTALAALDIEAGSRVSLRFCLPLLVNSC